MNYKVIKDYPNYIIFNTGKIYSKTSNKFLKPTEDKKKYHIINLRTYKKPRSFRLHKLVANYFIPNNNINYTQIDHIDRDKSNNHYSNLRWVNNSINQQNIGLRKDNKLKKKYITNSQTDNNYYYRFKINGVIEKLFNKNIYTLDYVIKFRDNFMIENNLKLIE